MRYCAFAPFTTVLKDGLEITLRDVVPTDSDLISLGFEQLSDQSRYFRFMAVRKSLSKGELERFSAINTQDHAAIGGFCVADHEPQPVGIARYVRLDAESTDAEIAITVVDGHQGRGVGTLLLGALAKSAHENGIECFIALIDSNNYAMRELLKAMGGSEEGINSPEVTVSCPIYQDADRYPDNRTGAFIRQAYALAKFSP